MRQWLWLVALLGAGCGDDAVDVHVAAADGSTPARLRAWLDVDGDVRAVDCADPAGAPAGVTCTADGLHLDGRPASLGVTVKAAGYHTARVTSGASRVDVALAALPAIVANDDYATGFGADGLDDFTALAVRIPGELGPASSVKFYIDLETRDVWFQDTVRHPLHYGFVHTVLGRAVSLDEFERRTYRGLDRTGMAGTLILYETVEEGGEVPRHPITIEFFPTDDLTPAQALDAYVLLEERLGFLPRPDGANALVYVPAGSLQEQQLAEEAHAFAAAGARALSRSTLYAGVTEQHLNAGVAYGTLRLLTPEELRTEIVSFRDVVVLTRLPNDLPLVGGTITAELQTPLAHVNVAARARGTPNLALLGAEADPTIAALLGKLVRFQVTATSYSLAETALEEAQAFWDEHTGHEPLVPSSDCERAGLLALDDLGFDDSIAVGVKAANVAELHHLLGEHAPDGFAVPFHYYDRFMAESTVAVGLCAGAEADCLEEGRAAAACIGARALCAPAEGVETLTATVDRLLDDAAFQTDSAIREATLDGLRWLIENTPIDATLAGDLDALVGERFGAAPVRLRSSTNAEDLESFTGAGLYSSYTAYATGEKAAHLRIRKTWASVWNWQAFEERAFWNVDHRAIRMGVLVHEAYPDERANGVLITQDIAAPGRDGLYVNAQLGEVSVTNPEEGALPEIFSIISAPGGVLQVDRQRYSSLSPGASLMSDEEIGALADAAYRVRAHFAPLYDEYEETLCLDIEWKLAGADRRLVLKQVRPYAGY